MHGRHEVILRVTPEGYKAGDDAAAKQHAKLKVGSLVGARIARSRSIQHQKMYWSVLSAAVRATDWWETPELLHIALKQATGYVTPVRLMNGRLILVPGSTSFDEMDQDTFSSYCQDAFRILADKLEMSVEALLEEANERA